MASEKLINKYLNEIKKTIGRSVQDTEYTAPSFDRNDKVAMENFSVFIKNEIGEYERYALDQYLTIIERLSDKKYTDALADILEKRNVYFYKENQLMPITYGTKNGLKIRENRGSVIDAKNLVSVGVGEGSVHSFDASAPEKSLNFEVDHTVGNWGITQDEKASRAAATKYYVGRINERKAEIENPKLIADRGIAREKKLEAEASLRLGDSKKSIDQILANIKPQGSTKGFDRFDTNSREDYFVMAKKDDGTYERQTLASFVADAEKLPKKMYLQKMNDLLEQRNIMVNEPGTLLPTTYGYRDGTNTALPTIRVHSRLFVDPNFDRRGNIDETALHVKSKGSINDNMGERASKELELLSDAEIAELQEKINHKRATDLPPREELPWYLKNAFFRAIVCAFSAESRENYHRITNINDAHDARDATGEYLKRIESTRIQTIKNEAANIVKRQNELLQTRPKEQKISGEKEKIAVEQNLDQELEVDKTVVDSYSSTIKRQASSDENAGWRIEDIFDDKPELKGFKDKGYSIDADKIPQNEQIKIDASSRDNFTEKNQAYFNFAKMLTTAYTTKEGSKVYEAMKDVLPENIKINEVPPTFVARQLLEEAFSGSFNENTNKILEPLIIEAKTEANKSIEQYNKGDPKGMGQDICGGANVLLKVLNSTTPAEFASQNSKWPIAAKCVKELLDITQKCPEIAKAYPIKSEMLNEMKGWAKVSDTITQSANAKKVLLSGKPLDQDKKEKLWKDIFMESKLRGLCAHTYKPNEETAKLIYKNNINGENVFAVESLREKIAVEKVDSKEIRLLGENDMLMQNVRDSVNIDSIKRLNTKNAYASWIMSHTEHNNMLNSEMAGDLVQNATKEFAPHEKVDEGKQLKSKQEARAL